MTFLYAWAGIGCVVGFLIDAFGGADYSLGQRVFCWIWSLACWPVTLLVCGWMLMWETLLRERPEPAAPPPPLKLTRTHQRWAKRAPYTRPLTEPEPEIWQAPSLPTTLH